MSQIHEFFNIYFDQYMAMCNVRNPFFETEQNCRIPPKSNELKELILYLQDQGADPIIGGTFAAIKHLKITNEDMRARTFRPTHIVEILIPHKLPLPPKGWQSNTKSEKEISWISPTGGSVVFTMLENSVDLQNNIKIAKDPESVAMGCPVTDLLTTFLRKLNSSSETDLLDLLYLVRRAGMPKEFEKQVLNKRQIKNFDFIRLILQKRGINI